MKQIISFAAELIFLFLIFAGIGFGTMVIYSAEKEVAARHQNH